MRTLSKMGATANAKDISEAVIFLMATGYVAQEVLHVDGGAQVWRW
jgi:hypothetical protein